MDRQELLSALRKLKSNFYRLGVAEMQLEQKIEAQNTARKNCSKRPPQKSLHDSLPDIYNVPDDAENLGLYDAKNKPPMVQMLPTNKAPDISQKKRGFLSRSLISLCIAWGAQALILVVFVVLKLAYQIELNWLLTIVMRVFPIIFFASYIWLTFGPRIRVIKCEIENRANDAKNQKNIMKYKADVIEYESKHRSDRQREYQKDIENSNKIYEKEIIKFNSYISSQKQIVSQLNDEIKQYGQQVKDIETCINNDTTLPAAYKNEDTIDKIIEYLKNFRADSIKEAVNLYEYETAMEKHNSSMRRAAWETALQAGFQADAMRKTADHQAQLAYEAQRQREAAEKAAESARKAAKSNEEALNIIKEWDKNSD